MRFDQITVAGEPVPGVIAVAVLWALNNYEPLARAGTGVYFYIPKTQTPHEALIIEKLLSRLEGLIGVEPGAFKIKVLYEEGNAGRFLPAIAWVLRKPAVTSALIGASSVRQLEDNLASLNNLKFSDEELDQIESILKS